VGRAQTGAWWASGIVLGAAVLTLFALSEKRRNDVLKVLDALRHNLANVLRQLALPRSIRSWVLTTLREKLVKIGAKVVTHAKYVVFQLAEVAVPRPLLAAILGRIGRLRLACASG
jgi:hypothetical protein